jgi:hypothetical protein
LLLQEDFQAPPDQQSPLPPSKIGMISRFIFFPGSWYCVAEWALGFVGHGTCERLMSLGLGVGSWAETRF